MSAYWKLTMSSTFGCTSNFFFLEDGSWPSMAVVSEDESKLCSPLSLHWLLSFSLFQCCCTEVVPGIVCLAMMHVISSSSPRPHNMFGMLWKHSQAVWQALSLRCQSLCRSHCLHSLSMENTSVGHVVSVAFSLSLSLSLSLYACLSELVECCV